MIQQPPVTYILGTQPNIGDIARGIDIGKKSKDKYIWASCKQCNECRWTKLSNQNRLCGCCSQKNRGRAMYFRGSTSPPTYVLGSEPRVGDIAMGRDIGLAESVKYVWSACQHCGKERWTIFTKHTKICLDCRNKTNGRKLTVTYKKGTAPEAGDIALGEDIGRQPSKKYRWNICAKCGTGRWLKPHEKSAYCHKCSQRHRSINSYYKTIQPTNYIIGETPKVGNIARGRDIGKRYASRYTWSKCPVCGKERWLVYRTNDSHTKQLCPSCSASGQNKARYQRDVRYGRWHGGRMKSKGYIFIKTYKEDPFFPMASVSGYIPEHRLVMARHLGRCLTRKEVVHHKNGDKADNRIENLELTGTISEHSKQHSKGYSDGFSRGYRDGSNKRIRELEQYISVLESSLFNSTISEEAHID